MKQIWHIITDLFRELLFFPCPGCRNKMGRRLNGFCSECLEKLEFIDRTQACCPGCGGIMDGALAVCSRCLAEPQRPWENGVAVINYCGYGRELIHRFKFNNFPELARPFGMLMAEAISNGMRGRADIIVPLPLNPARFRKRGYNQAALLAEIVGNESGIQLREMLKFRRKREKQSRRNRRQRHRDLTGLFEYTGRADELAGLRVLLLDDVLTTGATLHAAAEELRKGSPAALEIIVLARTPANFSGQLAKVEQ